MDKAISGLLTTHSFTLSLLSLSLSKKKLMRLSLWDTVGLMMMKKKAPKAKVTPFVLHS